MSSPLDYITLFKMLEGSSKRSSSEFDIFKFLQWQERRAELAQKKKEEEEKKKKEKDKTPTYVPKITYLEGVFWLCALSPVIGPAVWHLENMLINSVK